MRAATIHPARHRTRPRRWADVVWPAIGSPHGMPITTGVFHEEIMNRCDPNGLAVELRRPWIRVDGFGPQHPSGRGLSANPESNGGASEAFGCGLRSRCGCAALVLPSTDRRGLQLRIRRGLVCLVAHTRQFGTATLEGLGCHDNSYAMVSQAPQAILTSRTPVSLTTKSPITLADLPLWLALTFAVPVLPHVGHFSGTLLLVETTADYGRSGPHSNRARDSLARSLSHGAGPSAGFGDFFDALGQQLVPKRRGFHVPANIRGTSLCGIRSQAFRFISVISRSG
jgi:hypothetical protein